MNTHFACRLVSGAVAAALLTRCAAPQPQLHRNLWQKYELAYLEYCQVVARNVAKNPKVFRPDSSCENLDADYGQAMIGDRLPPPPAECSDDLYAPWEQRCPWAKVKTVLVAMTGGLLMGLARGTSSGLSSSIDSGRYKGYKTYDSTFSSPYGTTRCRTQLGDGRSYTSCN